MKIPSSLNSYDHPNLPAKSRARRPNAHPVGAHGMHYTRAGIPDNTVLGSTLMPGVNSLTLSGQVMSCSGFIDR